MDNTIKEDIESGINTEEQKVDTGLSCLVMIAQYHGVPADPAQLKHAYAVGNGGMNNVDIIRAAKELGFKAKSASVGYERLQKLPLPAIIKTGERQEKIKAGEGLKAKGEGNYVILAKVEADRVLVLNPAESKPKIIERGDFLNLWIEERRRAKGIKKGKWLTVKG